ncbi:MAG: M20/M25/M40 family metallo-hydrolase [Vicinamibacterales bacterium]
MRIPSDNPPGECAAIAQRVEEELERLGLHVERHDVPRSAAPPAPVVLGWLGPRSDTPSLLLNAHVDVVPPGEGWTVDPYAGVVRNGRIVGRGAAVSKSDVASYAYALGALVTCQRSLSQTAVVAITADEESGGEAGPRWLLDELKLRPQRAICAGFTHQIVVAHNGCIQGRISITARSSHAAMPWRGVDALREGQRVLSALYALDDELRRVEGHVTGIDSPTLVATAFRAGDTNGVTAGSAEIWIDRRVVPVEDEQDALSQFVALVARLNDESEAEISFEPTLVVQPLRPSVEQEELVEVIGRHAASVLGHTVESCGLPIFTDARWFAASGTPTVLFGAGPTDPGEARGHGPDENVRIDDLCHATKIVARVAGELVNATEEI